jgi:alpha-tubulin suppressor-like RCC1 family protein
MRGSLLLLIAAAVVAAGCEPRLGEGRYACSVADPGSCPDGFYCQVRAGDDGPRCYASAAPGVCGDGKMDEGEACEGEVSTTCHDLGYWRGMVRCTACQVDVSDCVPLVTVSVGPTVVCGVDAEGIGWCWGDGKDALNAQDQNQAHVEPLPLAVSTPLVDVQVGSFHACALAADGGILCWGAGDLIGSGAPLALVIQPWAVTSPVRFQQVSVGFAHTCGLDGDGQIWCWGYNYFGQLGDASFTRQTAPTRVVFPARFVEVVAAGQVTCGLDDAGQAWCWGQNGTGQLGDGRTDHASCGGYDCSPEPVAVAGGHRFTSLAGSRHVHLCALDDVGQAWCWGSNSAGQIGDGTTEDRWFPTAVTGDHRFVQVSAGVGRTTAIDEDGVAWSWGSGSPGDGTVDGGLVPAAASSGGPYLDARAGYLASCGLTAPGGLACWGFAGPGHLGRAPAGAGPTPVEIEAGLTVLAAGFEHTCGLAADGRAWCWGDNGWSQLGRTTWSPYAPGPVDGDLAFVDLAASWDFTAAIDAEGQLWLWGLVFTASSTTSRYLEAPERIPLTAPSVALTAGMQHLCVLDASGLASCWGNNLSGQLGTDGEWGAEGPVPVIGGHRFSGLSAGWIFTCGLDLDGAAWCWGYGMLGQIGDGNLADRDVPVAVATDRRFAQLACGGDHCCGLEATGAAWCWGLNWAGQLGTGWAKTYELTPQPVRSDVPFRALAAGSYHTCALDLDDLVWCWGGSSLGYPVPGPPGAGSGFVPTRVVTERRFASITSLGHHVCGLEASGAALCWGGNRRGQLGFDDHLTFPAMVTGPVLP